MGLAIVTGWTAFPRALYVRREQPLEFQHKTHSEKSGLTQCDSCHVLGSDGEFSGIAGIETCAGCHAEKIGTSKAEATLVDSLHQAITRNALAGLFAAAGQRLVLACHPHPPRRPGLQRLPRNHGGIGPAAILRTKPHQRLQPRYLGPFHRPASGALRHDGMTDERLRRLPPSPQRRGGLPRLSSVKEQQ